MSIASLPSDILFDIFTLLDDLRDLHAIASTSSPFYHAFREHRAQVLQHVFRNQIIVHRYRCLLDRKPSPHSKDDRSTPAAVLKSVKNTIAKCTTTRSDELILRTTAWTTFIKYNSAFWVFGSFAKDLLSCCKDLDRADLGLFYAAEFWKHLSARQTFEYSTHGNRHAVDRDTSIFAFKLAQTYFYDFNRPEDAVRVIQECYSMNPRGRDFKLLSQMVVYSKELSDQSDMLSFFQERAITEREGLHTFKTVNCDLHWTFCLIVILCELGKLQDAICVFNNIYDIFLQNKLNPVTIEGLTRRLIGALKDEGYFDEAFIVRQQMLTLLSRMVNNTTSQYMGWARQYISELYARGRPDVALVVEEQCWDRVRQRMALAKEAMYVFTGRNAAWSLSRTYERRGQLGHAKRVRWEYESLARECMKPGQHITWPGEGTGADLIGTGYYQELLQTYKPVNITQNTTVKV